MSNQTLGGGGGGRLISLAHFLFVCGGEWERGGRCERCVVSEGCFCPLCSSSLCAFAAQQRERTQGKNCVLGAGIFFNLSRCVAKYMQHALDRSICLSHQEARERIQSIDRGDLWTNPMHHSLWDCG